MINITGDIHGLTNFQKMGDPSLRKMSSGDFLIICGDLGAVFDQEKTEYMVNIYSYMPFTILFVDGNHENFDILEQYPEEKWNGGVIHRISENLIHLMRGQVFTVSEKKIFTFGGGLSYDKDRRVPHLSWWPQELPNESEMKEAKKNLQENEYVVDYVVTHDCPTHLLKEVSKYSDKMKSYGIRKTELNDFLDDISDRLIFKEWFFGHYHTDRTFGNYTCVFNEILRI